MSVPHATWPNSLLHVNFRCNTQQPPSPRHLPSQVKEIRSQLRPGEMLIKALRKLHLIFEAQEMKCPCSFLLRQAEESEEKNSFS